MTNEINYIYFFAEQKMISRLSPGEQKLRANLLKEEAAQVHDRFAKFVAPATVIIRGSAFTDPKKEFTENDFEVGVELLKLLATNCDDKVSPIFWAHPIMSAEYAETIEKVIKQNGGPDLNPWLLKSRLLIHDIGKLFKFRYMLSNQIASRFLKRCGVDSRTMDFIPPVEDIIGISGKTITGIENISLEQIIADVANDLGQPKLDPFGNITIKDTNEIIGFAKKQPQRYTGGVWINEDIARRALEERNGQGMAIELLKEEMAFLYKKYKVDFRDTRIETLKKFRGPKNQNIVKELQKLINSN